MKKWLAIWLLAAVISVGASNVASANEGEQKDSGRIGTIRNDSLGLKRGLSKFELIGTVTSTTTNSIVVRIKAGSHIKNLTDGQATISVNSNTKIIKGGESTLSDLKVGDVVKVGGTIDLAKKLTAISIKTNLPKDPIAQKTFGTVTGTTANALTINGTTYAVDSNTKIAVDGKKALLADVSAGFKGFVVGKLVDAVLTAKRIFLIK